MCQITILNIFNLKNSMKIQTWLIRFALNQVVFQNSSKNSQAPNLTLILLAFLFVLVIFVLEKKNQLVGKNCKIWIFLEFFTKKMFRTGIWHILWKMETNQCTTETTTYFGLCQKPTPKLVILSANTLTDIETTFQRENLFTIKGLLKPNLLTNIKYSQIIFENLGLFSCL